MHSTHAADCPRAQVRRHRMLNRPWRAEVAAHAAKATNTPARAAGVLTERGIEAGRPMQDLHFMVVDHTLLIALVAATFAQRLQVAPQLFHDIGHLGMVGEAGGHCLHANREVSRIVHLSTLRG